MKSFARHIVMQVVIVFLIGIVWVLAGCQQVPSTSPSNAALAEPTSTLIPSIGSAPTFTPISLPPPRTSTPTATPIPSLAYAPPPTRRPTDVPEMTDGRTGYRPIHTPAAPQPTLAVPRLFKESDLYIHVPPQADQRQPLRVLFVLHGMGARGDAFAQSLISDADRNNWVLVAPTMAYQDYMQPTLVVEDDLKISQMLFDTLEVLPARLNLKLNRRVLVYGFSRGAQLAHRFALLHPERVSTVATMSAGSYTLPLEHPKNDNVNPLPFPYGVGDFQKNLGHPLDTTNFCKVSFWIAVGERDNQPGDVPRSFDPYVGQNRIDRARAFANALSGLGMDARLVIFPNTGHEITNEMRKGAIQFLREGDLKLNSN